MFERTCAGLIRAASILSFTAALLGWSGAALAVVGPCPTPIAITVANNQSVSVDLWGDHSCSENGLDGIVTQPLHGSLPGIDPAIGKGTDSIVTYQNNGDPASTDTFVIKDDANNLITFNVTITGGPSSPLIVTPGNSANPVIGTSFNQSLSTTGGVAPYTYSTTPANLPAGITMNSAGVISGIATATGPFSFAVNVTDSTSPTPLTAVKNYSMIVAIPSLSFQTSATLPNGMATVAYNQQLATSGGTAPYTYSLNAGSSLPTGLTLSPSGVISGSPTTAGNNSFDIITTDSTALAGGGHANKAQAFSMTVDPAPPPPTVGPASATVGYNSGATPITLALSGSAATSVGIGTPAAHGSAVATGLNITYQPLAGYAGPDSFTYTATNAGGTSTPATATITVSAPTVTLTPPAGTVLNATALTPFSQVFGAVGGSGTYSFAQTATLPAGLSFSGSTVSGTPTVTGSYIVTVTATDTSTGPAAPFSSTPVSYTLNITAPTVSVSPITLPPLQRGVPYTPRQLSASGGGTSYTYAATGIPAGMALSTSGLFSGTPSNSGPYSMNVTATDNFGFQGSRAYSGTVDPGAPVANVSSLTVAYGSSANAITLDDQSEGLPTSVAIASPAAHGTATASGTGITYTPSPGYAGVDTFTYTASNAAGTSGAATASITISPPTITVAPATVALNATVGIPFLQTFSGSGGSGSYTFAQTGTLPTGLSFAGATLSGTPAQAGPFTVTITATDTSTGTGPFSSLPATYTLTIAAPTLGLGPSSIMQPEVNVPYSQQLTAANGIQPYTYSISIGTLPPGLQLSSAGLIHGMPTAAGPYSFSVTATDSSSFTTTLAYSGSVGAGAPVAAASTATVAYGSAANTMPLSLSGGTPTGLVLDVPAAHGSAAISGTSIAYTPATGYAGPDSFTYHATNTVGASSAVAVNITVSPATLSVTPSGAWAAVQGTSYSQTLTWSGGNPPYINQAVTGLPAGLTVTGTTATTMTISGTPTASGSFSLQASAADSSTGTGAPFTLTQPFTLLVGQAVPVAVGDNVNTNANQPALVTVTVNDGGAITGIAIGASPAHGTAVVSGLNVMYTPDLNYFGPDSFTYTDTGPGGNSTPATVSVTVVALGAPTSAPQNASVLPGQTVTLHVAAAAANGPITAVTIASPPATGSAAVSGADIIYTAPTGFSGNATFTYVLTNAFATSAPITATVSVGAVPIAANQSGAGAAGSTVVVDLMAGAVNGPFNAATLGAIAPANAGTAAIVDAGTPGNPSYRLRFTAAAAFSGTATIGYTLSNASGPSAAATVSIAIAARLDIAKDSQVTALITAQTATANRFATTQLSNFARRLESLHGDGWARSTFGLSMAPTTAPVQPQVVKWQEENDDRVVGAPLPWQANMRKTGWTPQNDDANGMNRIGGMRGASRGGLNGANSTIGLKAENAGNGGIAVNSGNGTLAAAGQAVPDHDELPELPGRPDNDRQALSLWIGGTVDFGQSNANGTQEGFRFTSSGVSMGLDYRVSDMLTLGVGTGFSRDSSDIGDNGSTNKSTAVVGSLYGSLRPTKNIFIDGVLGYGALDFDVNRYVTGDGSFATGSRKGKQFFTSISSGYEFHRGDWMLSPYGRFEMSSTRLDRYTEMATGNNALTYYEQTSHTSAGTLGLRAEGALLTRVGVWTPRMRVEYRREFSGADDAGISYADLSSSGPAYVVHSNGLTSGLWTAGLGVRLLLGNGMSIIADYSSNLNIGQGRYQSVLLGLTMPLP
ncbi:MAG TPA: autotransporter domain-containing protein [Herbaspirillum sp.]